MHAISLLVLLFSALLITLPLPAVRATNYTVNITNFSFQPPSIAINVNDTIQWTNFDSVAHTVTAAVPGVGALSSPILQKGEMFTHVFGVATNGSLAYICSIHPFMKGSVQVQVNNSSMPAVSGARKNDFSRNRANIFLFFAAIFAL